MCNVSAKYDILNMKLKAITNICTLFTLTHCYLFEHNCTFSSLVVIILQHTWICIQPIHRFIPNRDSWIGGVFRAVIVVSPFGPCNSDVPCGRQVNGQLPEYGRSVSIATPHKHSHEVTSFYTQEDKTTMPNEINCTAPQWAICLPSKSSKSSLLTQKSHA